MDFYKTISSPSEGYFTDKRSKFYAFAHPVETADEVKTLLASYRKKYYDARHVCWAYRLGPDGADFRANDDGEPSSTAGKPILGQMLSRELTNVAVFVVRYYGGINLGTGGLIVAYREASADALNNAEIVEKIVEAFITHEFPYPMMNGVMKVVKEMQPRVISQQFDNTCSITLAIAQSRAEELQKRLAALAFE